MDPDSGVFWTFSESDFLLPDTDPDSSKRASNDFVVVVAFFNCSVKSVKIEARIV